MSKRLQVLLDEAEFQEIEEVARLNKLKVAEWVRRILREARRRKPSGDAAKKLAVIRAAAQHSFPTAEIDEMLAHIEQGYSTAREP